MPMQTMPTTVGELRNYMDSIGSLWFSEDTMRAFGTHLTDPNIYGERFFITKETSRRRFTDKLYVVREIIIREDGEPIISSFGCDGFETEGQARNFIYANLM